MKTSRNLFFVFFLIGLLIQFNSIAVSASECGQSALNETVYNVTTSDGPYEYIFEGMNPYTKNL